jgi:hypothetical protein
VAAIYTDIDRLILGRWDEVSDILAAREELQGRVGEVIEVAGERLGRWLDQKGYLLDVVTKDGEYHAYRKEWDDKRRGPYAYFVLGGFCPRGYRKTDEPHPYLWLRTELLEGYKVKADERRALAASMRKALGHAASEWDDDGCDDADAPLGRYLVEIDNRARADIISSPEKLYAFATNEFPKIFATADVVERCVGRVLGR